MRNHKLLSVQSLDEVAPDDVGEKGARPEDKDIVIVNNYDDDPFVKFFLVTLPNRFRSNKN